LTGIKQAENMENTAKSIESADRELFDNIAHSYVQKDLKPYCRIARRLRLERTLKNIPRPMRALLEGGCGAGFSADYLKGEYIQFVGLDYSQGLIDYAERYNGGKNVLFVCKNITDYTSAEQFDVIFMIGVLHHIPDPAEVLQHLKRLLKPAGVLVVNEPQRGNPLIGLLRRARKFIDPKYSADQVEFSAAEVEDLFRRCGYAVSSFPQGVFSTPLAETRLLPDFVGFPLAVLFKYLDPIVEIMVNLPVLRRVAWNIVVEARLGPREGTPEN